MPFADIRLWKEKGPKKGFLRPYERILADKGYQGGSRWHLITPTKKLLGMKLPLKVRAENNILSWYRFVLSFV